MTKKLDNPKLEAYIVSSPTGLAELSDAVETALAGIEGGSISVLQIVSCR